MSLCIQIFAKIELLAEASKCFVLFNAFHIQLSFVLHDLLFRKSHFEQFGRNSTDISHIIAAKIRYLVETTKEIAENMQAVSMCRKLPVTLSLWSNPL